MIGVTHTGLTPSLTDHIALPAPERNLCIEILKLRENFPHFIRVISLPRTERNNTTSPKILRKRNNLAGTLSLIKSDLAPRSLLPLKKDLGLKRMS